MDEKDLSLYMLIQNKNAIKNHKTISNRTFKFKTCRHPFSISVKKLGNKPVA